MISKLERPSLLEVTTEDDGTTMERWAFLNGRIVEVHPLKVATTPNFIGAEKVYLTEDTLRLFGFSEINVRSYMNGQPVLPRIDHKGEN